MKDRKNKLYSENAKSKYHGEEQSNGNFKVSRQPQWIESDAV